MVSNIRFPMQSNQSISVFISLQICSSVIEHEVCTLQSARSAGDEVYTISGKRTTKFLHTASLPTIQIDKVTAKIQRELVSLVV